MPHSGQTGIVINSDRYRLLGRLFLAQGDDPKPTALILHGIPGIEQNYDIALMLRESGWNSVIFHYRGCWGSEGNYVLKTIPTDVRAAVDFLSNGTYPQIDSERLIVIGHSLGGWATVLGAVDDTRLRAVVAISAVTEPREPPYFDVVYAEENFSPWLNGITPEEFDRQWKELDAEYSAVEQVARISPRPLLILHAEHDDDVPLSQSQALYECAKEPRQLVIHPEANHSFTWHREWLRDQILKWITNIFILS